MPFYVSPEQLIKDRAEFARKGINRGRSVLAARYGDGIMLIAHNPSSTLAKIAEIYDRIAFAAVGKYNEFEMLRQAGVRYADLRGYSYDRADVTARGLTNAYAQTLANVFATASKPFEVELVVAELGATPETDQLFRLSYDGSVKDEDSFIAIGGQAEEVTARMQTRTLTDLPETEALREGLAALFGDEEIVPDNVEAAVLRRSAPGRRTFVRLDAGAVTAALDLPAGTEQTTEQTQTTAD